jgi:hypothetical protein
VDEADSVDRITLIRAQSRLMPMSTKQREDLERTLGSLLPPSSPAAFFISYRRNQDVWAARNIRSELESPFGEGSVFMDTESI